MRAAAIEQPAEDRILSLSKDKVPAPKLQRARGTGRITTQVVGGRTRIDRLFQEGCAKIRLPHTHDPSLQAVLINTAGGLTGGDVVEWGAEAAAGARLTLTTQACERIYRSLGSDAQVTSRLEVGESGRLDWLPQETILFEGARLDRRLEVNLADDATFCAVEAVLLGREAMGEDARNVRFRDSWRIRRNGRLLHAEATRLDGTAEERDSLSLLAGARAFGTVLYVGTEAARRADAIRDALLDEPGIGISQLGERLVVRAMAPSGLALRKLIAPLISTLSGAGALPRLWTL